MVPICHYRYHKRLPNSDIFNQIPLLLLYAAVCCTTVVTGFKSFVLLPIGDAVAIAATAVIWTCIMGFIFLREKLHWVDFAMIPVAIAGVILIARPPFIFGGHDYDENTLVGLIMAFVCSFAIGGIYICLRKIGNSSHYTITSLYYSVCGCSILGIVILFTTGFNFVCQSQLPYLLWLGTNGLVAMVFLQLALQREKAGRVGILRTSNVIFAYLFQILFTNDQANWVSLLGAGLVLTASVVMSARKLMAAEKTKE